MNNGSDRRKATVAIVGLGLIGASLAISLRPHYKVTGCSRSAESERYALSHGYIDETRALENLRGVDCVVVCTPLRILRETVEKVYSAVGDSAIITDVGSVKGILKGLPGRIVGGHPMAGNERSGIEAARAGLFEGARYCVVPYENSRKEDVDFVLGLTECAGAKPLLLSAERHDELAADFSHMPHMCAYALSESAINGDVSIAGSGFLDSTRIACSDTEFWTEVFRLNRANTLASLDRYMTVLGDMRDRLAHEDYDGLRKTIDEARTKRKALGDERL